MVHSYRHGYRHKQGFQRKSQRSSGVFKKKPVLIIWIASFLVSAVLIVSFFITQHFVSKGVKSGKVSEQNIFQANSALLVEVGSKESVTKELLENSSKVISKPVKKSSQKTETVSGQPSTMQSYSFYEGLGKTSVVVNAEPISVQLKDSYYIQVATLSSQKKAEYEQKRLGKLGQALEISVIHIHNQTHFRLRIGPFQNRLIMNKKLNKFKRLGLSPQVIKAKEP